MAECIFGGIGIGTKKVSATTQSAASYGLTTNVDLGGVPKSLIISTQNPPAMYGINPVTVYFPSPVINQSGSISPSGNGEITIKITSSGFSVTVNNAYGSNLTLYYTADV